MFSPLSDQVCLAELKEFFCSCVIRPQCRVLFQARCVSAFSVSLPLPKFRRRLWLQIALPFIPPDLRRRLQPPWWSNIQPESCIV